MKNKKLFEDRVLTNGFAERFLLYKNGEQAATVPGKSVEKADTKAAEKTLNSLNRLAEGYDREKWLQEKKEAATKNLRKNMQAVLAEMRRDKKLDSLWSNAISHKDYEIADEFQKRLKEKYDGNLNELSYVEAALDKETSTPWIDKETGLAGQEFFVPAEDPLELGIKLYEKGRSGSDTRAIPEYMWVKYVVKDGVPGIKIRWTRDKYEPATVYSEYKFMKLSDNALGAPKEAPKTVEGQEFLSFLPDFKSVDTRNNPYAKAFLSAVNKRVDTSNAIGVLRDRKNESLVLQLENGQAKLLDGEAYRGLYWKEISQGVLDKFKGKNISEALLASAVAKKNADVVALVEKVSKGETINKQTLNNAHRALEKFRETLSPGVKRQRERAKTQVESHVQQQAIKLELQRKQVKLPKSSKMKAADFSGNLQKELNKLRDGTNPWKQDILRQGLKVDANHWNVIDGQQLRTMYADWEALSLPVESPYYTKLFVVLQEGRDSSKNPYMSDPDYKKLFNNPLAPQNISKIRRLDPQQGFDPQAYANALEFVFEVKVKTLARTIEQEAMINAQKSLDANSIADTTTDFLRDNWNKFTGAIREGDYATAAIYGIAAYGIYRSVKSLLGESGKYSKYMWYAVGGYGAYLFAKNAGFDIGEKLGLTNPGPEVEGTVMEAIPYLGLQEAEDLNYDVFAKLGQVNVSQLNDLYMESHDNGLNFIDPANFPHIFPELARIGYFPMGIGEGGLDVSGAPSKKLSPMQRKYVETGQQIYKSMLVLRQAYEKTVGAAIGKSFEAAMQDPVLRESQVWHLCAQVGLYAPAEYNKTIMERVLKKDKAEKLIKGCFEKVEGTDFELSPTAIDGKYTATINGYPVIIRYHGHPAGDRIYLPQNYGGDMDPGIAAIAELPLENAQQQKLGAERAVRAITSTVEKAVFDNNITKPEYKNGEWKAKIKAPGNANFDIDKQDIDVNLSFVRNGKDVDVVMNHEVLGSANLEGIKKYPNELLVLNKIVESYGLLEPMLDQGALKIEDADENDNLVSIELGAKNYELKFGSGEFGFVDKNDEQNILQDKNFAEVLAKSAMNEAEVEKLQTEVIALMEATPEEFVSTAFEGMKNWILEMYESSSLRRPGLENFSGSVSENYTKALLTAKTAFLQYKLMDEVGEEANFADANNRIKKIIDLYTKTLGKATGKLELLIKEKNVNKEDYQRLVFERVAKAGVESPNYQVWLSQFANEVFTEYGWGDLEAGKSQKAAKAIEVFAYYTAGIEAEIPKSANLLDKVDPSIDAYRLRARYANYVHDRIILKLRKNPNTIEDPEKWDIDSWEEYQANIRKDSSAYTRYEKNGLASLERMKEEDEKDGLKERLKNMIDKAIEKNKKNYFSVRLKEVELRTWLSDLLNNKEDAFNELFSTYKESLDGIGVISKLSQDSKLNTMAKARVLVELEKPIYWNNKPKWEKNKEEISKKIDELFEMIGF